MTDEVPACPVCDSDDDVEKTAADDDGSWRWYCYKCGESWDAEW
jgi:transposase-like protein